MLYRLQNSIQYYSWGSPSLLPAFLGLPNPEGKPWAELWMGTHPQAPSRVLSSESGESLADFIARDPQGLLGRPAATKFGGTLPFLFKVLAAGSPLSIQCHPDAVRAREGFAEENRRGFDPASAERNYRDGNHKPEILTALTPFFALRGFRKGTEILRYFSGFPAELKTLAKRHLPPGTEDFGPFLRALLGTPRDRARNFVAEAQEILADDRSSEAEWFRRLAPRFPDDPGCFSPFYLNLVSLEPGEALYIGAGELHAYLGGLGLELMANSDNVLRGGLTPKRIDLEELLRVAVCRPGEAGILKPQVLSLGPAAVEETYPTPAEEFTLSVLRNGGDGPSVLDVRSAEILLGGGGDVELASAGGSFWLRKGEAVFVPASEGRVEIRGKGTMYRARVPA